MKSNNNNSKKLGFIEGWLSAVMNLLLFGLKLWVGLITGSVALIADAWHTLSDTLSSIVIIFGFWASQKPPDEEHPFGHGRAELIAAIVIATLLAVVGINFFVEAINQLVEKKQVVFGTAAIVVTAVSVLVKEGLAQFAFFAAKRMKSKALKADAWHHRSDAVTSLIILAGVFLSDYFWWIDGALGLIVTIFILKVAWEIFYESSHVLLGEKPDEKLKSEIRDVIKTHAGTDFNMHHFHLHQYGDHLEVTFHICLPGEENLDNAHKQTKFLENLLRQSMDIEATIHIDPEGIND